MLRSRRDRTGKKGYTDRDSEVEKLNWQLLEKREIKLARTGSAMKYISCQRQKRQGN